MNQQPFTIFQLARMWIHRFFTHNLLLKIISFLLAVMLWFSITGGPRLERSITVQLDLDRYIPEGWSLAKSYISEIELRLRGPDNMIQRFSNSAEARAEISINLDRNSIQPKKELQRLRISSSNVILRSGLEVISISPQEILVQIDRTRRESKPVRVNLSGSLPEGYQLFTEPEVRPDTVTVEGAESLLAQLESIGVNLNLSNIPINGSGIRSIPVPIEREALLRYGGVAEAEVILDIVEVSESKRIDVNQISFIGYDQASETVSYNYRSSSWEITGPKSWIDDLSSDSVQLLIDLTGKERNQQLQIALSQDMLQFSPTPLRRELVTATLRSSNKTINITIKSTGGNGR